jgi:hypothetical protein
MNIILRSITTIHPLLSSFLWQRSGLEIVMIDMTAFSQAMTTSYRLDCFTLATRICNLVSRSIFQGTLDMQR